MKYVCKYKKISEKENCKVFYLALVYFEGGTKT